MSAGLPLRRLVCFWLLLLFVALPLPAPGQPGRGEKLGGPVTSPEALPGVLEEGAASLRGKIGNLESQVKETTDELAGARNDLQDLEVAAASLKAALAVKKLPLAQVQELIATYAHLESDLKTRSKDLGQEIIKLKKAQAAETQAQNLLRMQMSILQDAAPQGVLSPELAQAYLNYLNLAVTRDRLMSQVLLNLAQRQQLLEKQKELLAGLQPLLKQVEEVWNAELLARPAERVSFTDQAVRLWKTVAALPGRAWDWLTGLIESGRLAAFFWDHLTHLVGLLGFIVLLGWSTRRLSGLVGKRFLAWRASAPDHHLLPLFVLGHILSSNLFLLGLILWVGVFCWTFGMLNSPPALLILYFLAALWALRLGVQWVQGFFAGKAAGGVLSLDLATARFYRRSLKLFLTYLVLGTLGVKSALILNFPETSRLFLEHFFLVGALVWVLWLWRRPYLAGLLRQLADPAWIKRPTVSSLLRGSVLTFLVIIILADLLGFQNLSFYLAQAVTWTLLALAGFWFLWLAVEKLILHLLHPEKGWAPRRYPEREELLQRIYHFSRWVSALVVGAAVALWSLDSWGIKPDRVAWAFQWLAWGPTLGPLHLTILNVGGAVLALYLGLWLSRLLRGLMLIRIFPRTGLDTAVQYTISTTVHYVILILTGLIALNILGFPLTNLALVAGALGVGIGFGLQNIVNNFLSGLILLFERPIKVGDMLVIDGQWGTVKEIRVRSTVFETFDRSVLIIPNSELVSAKVLNWTHYGQGVNRLTLKVGVSYGSEVRQVTRLLTEVCQANPRVVAEPPPQIYFAVYGDSSLEFTIWVFVKTPADRIPATHELNSAILATFQQHGIETPFPQRDLHIKEWPGAPEAKGES